MAKVCWRQMSSRYTTVKARKPGISRTDSRMPRSSPVKATFSTAKLLMSAIHGSKAMGMAAARMSSRICGLRHPSFRTPRQSVYERS